MLEVNIVNKRQTYLFLRVLLCCAAAVFMPYVVSAQEAVTIPGISEVEENHLYMVPAGTDDGLKKGDTVEIVRDDQKVAEARLISVLSDNSMVEIVVMFMRTDILESDAVRFISQKEKGPAVRKTLGGARTLETGSREASETVKATEETRRGLLGSEMHRYEEEAEVEGPLKEEIASLKAGLASAKEDYETKVDTILSSVGPTPAIEKRN